jgi:hypothetical protein
MELMFGPQVVSRHSRLLSVLQHRHEPDIEDESESARKAGSKVEGWRLCSNRPVHDENQAHEWRDPEKQAVHLGAQSSR